MADSIATTTTKTWETALAEYKTCRAAYEAAQADCDDAEIARDAAEERLLLTPAPHLLAVAEKLRTIWSPTLSSASNDPYAVAQRMLIEEVERLQPAKA